MKSLVPIKGGASIIETTAIEMCAAFYDVAMQQGMPTSYKSQRAYVKKNWEKFVPRAVDACLQILGGDYPDEMKKPIYAALIERANTPMPFPKELLNGK